MKSPLFLIATALFLAGCGRPSTNGFDHVKLASDVASGSAIRLTDYTQFDWERVYVFAPYTPAKTIEEVVGSSVSFPNHASESHCLLVFLSSGRVVGAFEVERRSGDFADVFQKAGYSREEALFAVEIRGSDSWRYLKKQTTNQSGRNRPWLISTFGKT